MHRDDETEPRRKVAHEIGCDLSAISQEELELRIGLLREEIQRLQAEVEKKHASRQAAASFFKQ